MNDKEIKILLIVSSVLTVILSIICAFFSKICAVLCLALGIILIIIFTVVTKRRYKNLNDLNDYLSLVCKGIYDMNIDDNTEGELSILKNNLYKVITLLQSQNEYLKNDKLYLADSIADISHQLKTPLTSMMVMCELLENEENPDKRQEFVSVINNQLSKMKWLITNILKISKLDADATEFKRDEVSISKVLDDSLKPFALTAELKNIAIQNGANDFIFNGDESWTVEAISNIVKNCLEHTNDGGKITISSESTNLYNKLTISDNGCGIAEEDLPHIFERFYHGKNSSKDSVGIGLALAKTVFEKENASVTVESEQGRGSVFEIRFYKSVV
ncbi:MAG: HAMP domain-containing sensor histidine kinase [Eubacterium coprostanoligenes]|uniref:sensor histidine kinase n=1 Tax=Eubacterium coprostanoligenes TaxID=290054 RepID=UPI002409CF99|nr:HAMP domain-containing sensor histidine kinase [Eubacterium coprostanoligenes]MDD6666089.1 HAMP domain-containing sensor histidine kinase [Eubacterium coprostanoligenes]